MFGDALVDVTASMQIADRTGPIKLSLRPEVLEIRRVGNTSPTPMLRGVIVQRAYMGPVIEYTIKTKIGELFTRGPASACQFEESDEICLHIQPENIIIIPDNIDEELI